MDVRASPPPSVDRAHEPERLYGLDSAVERHPRHDLRMSEMLASASHLPNAFVGGAPLRFQMFEQRDLKLPRGREVLESTRPRMMGSVHHLAENIELELVDGGVADAHGFRVLIPTEPRRLALGQPSFARGPVHDLKIRRASSGGAEQPIAKRPRLFVIPRVHQREERQRGVAQPTIAIVPIARAPQLLGQRGGWRGDDAPRRRIGQSLQRDQRARDNLDVLFGATAGARPRPPEFVPWIAMRLRRPLDREEASGRGHR